MQNRKPSPWGEGGWPKARRMRGQVSASSFVEAAHRTAWERPDEGIGPYEKNEPFLYPPQGRVPSPARKPSPGGRWLAEGQTDEGAGLRLLFCRGGTLYRLGTAR